MAHSASARPHTVLPEHVFFMRTGTKEKIQQLNWLAGHFGYKALFLADTDLGNPAHSPEEKERNYARHADIKCATLAALLNRYSAQPENLRLALNNLGFTDADIRKIKFHGVAEDSGMAFDTQGFTEHFFDTSENGPYKTQEDRELVARLKKHFYRPGEPFPGTETAPVFGAAGGYENLSRLINLAVRERWQPDPRKPNKRPGGKEPMLWKENSTISMFDWTPGEMLDLAQLRARHFFHTSALFHDATPERNGYGDHQPEKPGGVRPFSSYNNTVPKRARLGFRTRDELSAAYQPYSRGVAFEDMMREMGVKRDPALARRIKKGECRIGSRETVREDAFTVATPLHSPSHVQALSQTVRRANMKLVIDFGAGQPDTHNPERLHGAPSLLELMNDFRAHDAFVLKSEKPKNGAKPKEEHRREQVLREFMYLNAAMIHKTLDPEGGNKTIILQGDDWQRKFEQMATMFNRGSLGDRPDQFVKFSADDATTVKLLKEARRDYHRIRVTQEEVAPVPDIDTGKYNVCVFLSAGYEGIYEDKSRYLGYQLEKEGMVCMYGAANRNMMGGLLHGGLLRQKRERPLQEREGVTRANVAGSTTSNIATRECEGGMRPPEIPDEFYYHGAYIEPRKEFLFRNSHSFVCLEGGVGTLDELATYLWYRHTQPELVKGKPFIISESAYTQSRMFEPFMELYFGEEYKHGDARKRKAMLAESGITVMPKVTLPEAGAGTAPSRRKLYELEMDAVMKLLVAHRAKHYPDLAPDKGEGFVQRTTRQEGDRQAPWR